MRNGSSGGSYRKDWGWGVGREVGEWVLGNSEGMRENRSYVSMETVILIESSVPDWGCGIK